MSSRKREALSGTQGPAQCGCPWGADFDRRIAQLIAAEPDLRQTRALVQSIPGVGPVTAATLMALVPELGQRSPNAIAALAGLAPFNHDSGQ